MPSSRVIVGDAATVLRGMDAAMAERRIAREYGLLMGGRGMTPQAPFPWFGGKSRVADLVWQRVGNVPNYVEPFFGSGAVLLARPHPPGTETINDKDGYVANFWRAVKHDPEAVAEWADNPVSENDLHARHAWLLQYKDGLVSRLEGDPDWHDPKIAGWWCWGICCWIGSGFCSGDGPWQVLDGKLVHLGNAGRGVNRQLVHLGRGWGVNRKRVQLLPWFAALSERLRNVRVCCGDWTRVCGPTPTVYMGTTGVFLDPPYSAEAERAELYTAEDMSVAHAVAEWAREHGDDPAYRIALCGYEGEHVMPDDWECVAWKALGGYGSQGQGRGRDNCHRERIWFSPHCLGARQMELEGTGA